MNSVKRIRTSLTRAVFRIICPMEKAMSTKKHKNDSFLPNMSMESGVKPSKTSLIDHDEVCFVY